MNWLCSILGRSSAKTENRYCVRFPTIGKIRISWQDRRGKTRRKRASIVNMSGTGALIKCGAFIPPGSFVYIQSRELGIRGGAYVRHCEPRLVTYQIGLQFAEGG